MQQNQTYVLNTKVRRQISLDFHMRQSLNENHYRNNHIKKWTNFRDKFTVLSGKSSNILIQDK